MNKKPLKRRDFLTTSIAGAAAFSFYPLAARAAKPTDLEQSMRSAWNGKSVVITGGTSGIGHAAVLAFASLGSKVTFCGRNEKKGALVAKQAKDAGGAANFVRADITSDSEVKSMMAAAVKEFGRIDIAVNCVGIADKGKDFIHDPLQDYVNVIQTNLIGTMITLRHELEQMVKQGGGVIVNIGSATTYYGKPLEPAYTASKMGVWGFTKSLSKVYAKKNIRINTISPSYTNHEMGNNRLDEDVSSFSKKIPGPNPRGYLINIDEVVQAVLWLTSNGSSGLSGQNILLDGGLY